MGLCLKPCLNWALFWPPTRNVDYTQENLRSIYGASFTILTTPHGSQIPFVLCRKESEENVNARPCVLFSHGNAEDLYNTLKFCNLIQRMCQVNVAAYDYTGYGIATGTPSESNVYNDVLTVYHHITRAIGIHPANVIVWGRSLGSGPTVHLASKIPVRGMVLHSPLLSALRTQPACCVCARCACLCCYPDAFPNIDKVGTVDCPVFIIHGTKDAVVPFWHGKYLHKHLKRAIEPLWVDGAGHNDILNMAKQSYMEKAKEFISYLYTLKFDGKTFSSYSEGLDDRRLYLFGGRPLSSKDTKSPPSEVGSVIHGPTFNEYAIYQSQVSQVSPASPKEEEAEDVMAAQAGSPLTSTSSFSYSSSYVVPPPVHYEEKSLLTSKTNTSFPSVSSMLPISLPPSPSKFPSLNTSTPTKEVSSSTTPLLRDSSTTRYYSFEK